MTADSPADVSRLLRAEGKYPTSIQLAAAPAARSSAVAPGAACTVPLSPGADIRIARADVIQIATQLAVMTESGVLVTDALECIGAQMTKPQVRRLLEDLHAQVRGGSDFSLALARHPRSFPRLFVAMVQASEKTGLMAKMLLRGTTYLRDEQEMLRKIKGALTYPFLMLGFAVTTTVFLLAFVLPRFAAIYAQKRAALPLPTKILMLMSNVVVAHWPSLVTGTIATTAAIWLYVRSAPGARVWHWVQLHIPLIGSLFRQVYLSRALRMIGTMGSAGVGLLDCVSTARQLCGNSRFADLWDGVFRQIQAGRQFSEPLFHSDLVPRYVAQMLHSGEKGGRLCSVMEQVASYAEAELKERIAQLTRYIEPAMIIIMGAIIGGIAMALLLPIFTISRVVAR